MAAAAPAFQALLFRHSGQADLVVGTPVANRDRLEIEGIIGFFVNTLALRGRPLGATRPSGELLGAGARGRRWRPMPTRICRSRSWSRSCAPERLTAAEPALPGDVRRPAEAGAAGRAPRRPAVWRRELLESIAGTSKLDLTLQLVDAPDGIAWLLEFDADLFDAATVERLGRAPCGSCWPTRWPHPDCRLGDLPLLTAGERHQIEVEWNDSRSAWPGR